MRGKSQPGTPNGHENTRRSALGIAGPLVAVIAVIAVTGVVFREALELGRYLWGPDSGAFAFVYWKRALPDLFMGFWEHDLGLGRALGPVVLVPYRLLLYLLPALSCQVWTYIAAVLGTVGAMAYFLRGRGVGWSVSLMAGLAFAYSGHSFTLIAAGHMGKLEMMPFGVLLVATVERGIRDRSWFHFAAAGLCAGFAFVLQADVMFLYALVAAAYGILVFIRSRPRGHGPENTIPLPRAWGLYLAKLVVGVVLAAAFFVPISWGTMRHLFTERLPDRAKIIDANTQAPGDASTKALGDAKRQWEFSTNWSLPLEDALEFVAPCVYGIQTGDARGPYWGKLGRTLGWEQHQQGLRNLRQHTVYLGVLQMVFAALAIGTVLRRRRPGDAADSAVTAADTPGFRVDRAQVWFWTAVAVVSLLLAFGRHLPFYRLFYMIPYASNMRAPVKLLHLVEFSLCVLFAFGVATFLKMVCSGGDADAPKIPVAAWIAGGAGVLLFAASLLVGGAKGVFFSHWRGLGFEANAELLMRMMQGALRHGGALFLVAGALLVLPRYIGRFRHARIVLFSAILVALSVDLASVGGKYVVVWDENLRYTPREIVAELQRSGSQTRVSLPVPQGIYAIWGKYCFRPNGVVLLDEINAGSRSDDEKAFVEALSRRPLRLWQLTCTGDVLAPRSSVSALETHPACRVMKYFNVNRDGSAVPAAEAQAQHVWLRMRGVFPKAFLYRSWIVLTPEQALARLADPGWTPSKTALICGETAARDTGQPPGSVSITRYDPNRIDISVDSEEGGIVVLNDKYDAGWRVTVDGNEAEVVRCNYVMRGVRVEGGKHDVVFTYRPHQTVFVLSAGVSGLFVLWWVVRAAVVLWRRKKCRRP